jgi:hypothetical protein
MEILLRQASSNENQHLLTLELSDWMEYCKKLHYHRRIADEGNFFIVVELIIKKGKGKGRERKGKRREKGRERKGKE